MEEVGYAEPTYRDEGGHWQRDRLDTGGYEAAGYDPRAPDPGDAVGALMQRAIGEQIAEQRMIREALGEFDRRLEVLERTTADRLADLERSHAERTEGLERGFTERMVAFETVLKRVVDRLTGAEERIIAGLEHNEKVARVQLDALRPAIEAAAEMLAGQIEQSERVTTARLEAVRPTVEATVAASLGPELEKALAGMRASLEVTERKVRRDVNRIVHAMGDGEPGEPFEGFEPVHDDAPSPRRQRERPLRASRS